MKDSAFRNWVNNIWFEHKREVLSFTGKPCDYDVQQYFNKYKWWLKREFISQIVKKSVDK